MRKQLERLWRDRNGIIGFGKVYGEHTFNNRPVPEYPVPGYPLDHGKRGVQPIGTVKPYPPRQLPPTKATP